MCIVYGWEYFFDAANIVTIISLRLSIKALQIVTKPIVSCKCQDVGVFLVNISKETTLWNDPVSRGLKQIWILGEMQLNFYIWILFFFFFTKDSLWIRACLCNTLSMVIVKQVSGFETDKKWYGTQKKRKKKKKQCSCRIPGNCVEPKKMAHLWIF